jgi:hypothetical protein
MILSFSVGMMLMCWLIGFMTKSKCWREACLSYRARIRAYRHDSTAGAFVLSAKVAIF